MTGDAEELNRQFLDLFELIEGLSDLPPGALAAANDTQKRLGAHKALADMLDELDGMGGETMDPGPFRHGYREALGDVRTVIQRAMDRVLEGGKRKP